MIRVRIRGIAATALSKIVFDKGYTIVQASQIIQNRLNIEFDPSPADVTVKDSDKDELLVLGFYGKADKVYRDIVDELEYVFQWISPLGLYSVHVGRVIEKNGDSCIIELPGGNRGVLSKCGSEPGKTIVVSVIRPKLKPCEEFRLTREIRVVGEYISLIYGSSRITISEHIRDPSRREYLLALAATKLIGSGLGIHFRSSSRYASDKDILDEIDRLRSKLSEIIRTSKEISEVKTLYEGEFIGLIGLTSIAKKKLDYYRSMVVSTVEMHHSCKTYGGCLSDIVDYSEALISEGYGREKVSSSLRNYLYNILKSQPLINIIHVRPDGKKLRLTPGKPIHLGEENGKRILIIKRILKSSGVLDGLGIERKPGDIDYMYLVEDEWWISHNYYRGEEWLGTYININTPPEILPDTIKYHDLAVDIVINNNGEAKTIDIEELEKYHQENIIPEKLYRKTKETIEEILKNPEKHIYKPSQE